MPSTFDTCGLVLREAAAGGTPTLAPTNTSYDEVLTDGVTGFSKKLSVKQWADYIQKIFSTNIYKNVQSNCQKIGVNWNKRMKDVLNEYEYVIKNYKSKKEIQ